jgi:hypothetical protein
MPEEKDPPRPHGDKLGIGNATPDIEENLGQASSDAPTDAVGVGGREENDREGGRGSDANGVPAFDEADGAQRKRQYKDGATLVSGLD